jgi:16S rRNA (cytosine967-C5)-methyltransferase
LPPLRPAARAQAAIEVLADLVTRHRPAADSLRDWGLSHRFAGARDRAEIGDLVFGALRWKASSAWRMGSDDPRAWVLGALRWGFARTAERIEQDAYESPHAYSPLTEAERAALASASLEGAPAWVGGDYPEWLDPSLAQAFGDDRAAEGAALAAPAPLDLRVNRLKAGREAVRADISGSTQLRSGPDGAPPQVLETPLSPDGLRLPWQQGRIFPWAKEPSFLHGCFEVQDEGSQISALLAGAGPGSQVADVCAGGGGKALALAALMGGRGQVFAHDVDSRRLANIHERIARAGARNIQVRTPRRDGDVLADLTGQMDAVFVDAPCSGSGTWRRAPDSKWRLRPGALDKRLAEQLQALALAAPLVRPGGRLVYVTCSVLPQENAGAIAAFLADSPGFAPDDMHERCADAGLAELPARSVPCGPGLQMTPRLTGTDGFFVCILTRRP